MTPSDRGVRPGQVFEQASPPPGFKPMRATVKRLDDDRSGVTYSEVLAAVLDRVV